MARCRPPPPRTAAAGGMACEWGRWDPQALAGGAERGGQCRNPTPRHPGAERGAGGGVDVKDRRGRTDGRLRGQTETSELRGAVGADGWASRGPGTESSCPACEGLTPGGSRETPGIRRLEGCPESGPCRHRRSPAPARGAGAPGAGPRLSPVCSGPVRTSRTRGGGWAASRAGGWEGGPRWRSPPRPFPLGLGLCEAPAAGDSSGTVPRRRREVSGRPGAGPAGAGRGKSPAGHLTSGGPRCWRGGRPPAGGAPRRWRRW